jgi:hypothetical protein
MKINPIHKSIFVKSVNVLHFSLINTNVVFLMSFGIEKTMKREANNNPTSCLVSDGYSQSESFKNGFKKGAPLNFMVNSRHGITKNQFEKQHGRTSSKQKIKDNLFDIHLR